MDNVLIRVGVKYELYNVLEIKISAFLNQTREVTLFLAKTASPKIDFIFYCIELEYF